MEATTLKRPKIPKETHKNHEEKYDPLTSLQEPLLHHILSCLAMKDVVRTSVLPKRWRHIWLYVPCLKFSPLKLSRSKEVAFINQSLLFHKGPAIQKFSLTFLQHDAEPHHVDSWIYFAKTRNIQELNLDFCNNHPETPSVHCYRLPHFLFSFTSLTALSLVRCEIHFPVKGKLSSLKILSLEQVYFSGGTITDLTNSNSNSWILITDELPKICRLQCPCVFWEYDQDLKDTWKWSRAFNSIVLISAACITSFELVTSRSRKFYFIHGMKSIESARFGCDNVTCGQVKLDNGMIIFWALDDVRHVKYLRMCSCYIQVQKSSPLTAELWF